jgi:hypothetical protein
MTVNPNHRALIVKDVADAPMLRICLREALAELEIAMGFNDWNGVRRALELIREGLRETSGVG